MQDRDLTTAGVVLRESRITVAGTIIGEMLRGIWIALAPFLLLIPAVLVVSSATLTVFSIPGNPPGSKKDLICRTIP
jgi:hypothetical protein